MVDHSWLIILSVSFFVMTLSFLAAIFFLIYAAVELKKASVCLRDFLRDTQEKVYPLIEEAQSTVKEIRRISEDVSEVSDNMRDVSDGMAEVAGNLRALSSLIAGLQEGISVRVSGVRAGIRTALDVFMKKLSEGRHVS